MEAQIDYNGSTQLSIADIRFLLTERGSDLLIAAGVLCLAICIFFIVKAIVLGPSLKLRRVTLPSFFLAVYILFISIPSVIWFAVSTHPSKYSCLLAVQSTPIFFLMGCILASCRFRNPSRIVAGFLTSRLTKSRFDLQVAPLYVLFVIASFLVLAVYVLTAEYVPLIASLTNYGAIGGEDIRFGIYKVPEGIQYAYALAVRFLLPISSLYSYFMACIHKGGWIVVFWATFAFTLISALLSLERSGPLGVFMLLTLAVYFKNNMTISRKSVFVFVVALFVGGLIHQFQYQMDVQLSDTIKYMSNFLINRVYLDPSYMTFAGFQEYGYSTGFLMGRSIRLLSLFGFEYKPYSSLGFVGDLWVNFGWVGVSVGAIFVGFVLQFIQLKFFKMKTIPIVMIFIMLLLNSVWILYGSVLSTMVVSVYVLSVLLLRFLMSPGKQVTASVH